MAQAAKQMSIRERLEAKRAANAAPAPAAEDQPKKRGRKPGSGKSTAPVEKKEPKKRVKYVVSEKHQEKILNKFTEIETAFNDLSSAMNPLTESGGKSFAEINFIAKNSRSYAQLLVTLSKDLRVLLNDAKEYLSEKA